MTKRNKKKFIKKFNRKTYIKKKNRRVIMKIVDTIKQISLTHTYTFENQLPKEFILNYGARYMIEEVNNYEEKKS